jgi:hypothetical protein
VGMPLLEPRTVYGGGCRLSISPGCDPVMGDNRAKQ